MGLVLSMAYNICGKAVYISKCLLDHLGSLWSVLEVLFFQHAVQNKIQYLVYLSDLQIPYNVCLLVSYTGMYISLQVLHFLMKKNNHLVYSDLFQLNSDESS